MTRRSWLDGRLTRPPEPLEVELRARLGEVEGAGDPATVLQSAAEDALQRALGQPGRVRGAAFDLLAADALLTYACEVALEGDDPEGDLDALVALGRRS